MRTGRLREGIRSDAAATATARLATSEAALCTVVAGVLALDRADGRGRGRSGGRGGRTSVVAGRVVARAGASCSAVGRHRELQHGHRDG